MGLRDEVGWPAACWIFPVPFMLSVSSVNASVETVFPVAAGQQINKATVIITVVNNQIVCVLAPGSDINIANVRGPHRAFPVPVDTQVLG